MDKTFSVNVSKQHLEVMRSAVETLPFNEAKPILDLVPAVVESEEQDQYLVELSDVHWNVIGGALGKFPYVHVAPIMDYLKKEIAAQEAAQAAESAPAPAVAPA